MLGNPVRTCIVCRKSAGKPELLRLVIQNGNVEIDEKKLKGGRGGWIHQNCLQNLKSIKALQFAFRLSNEDVKKLQIGKFVKDLSAINLDKNKEQ